MSILDIAKQRFSVRNYLTKEISQETLETILEAAHVAPTAANMQPVKLLVVKSDEAKEKLAKAANIYSAPVAIIVCADTDKAWTRPFDGMKTTDIDASIITDHMMLTATEQGLGSVWICYFKPDVIKEEFKLPKFPTTTIGSFPQTKDVKANRSAFKRGEKTEQEYVDFNKKKIAECVKWQEEIGIDVLVHGEYERNDMVEYFGESLGGFLFTQKAWVQSYGTRCVKPPIIWGDVYRNKPITVEWSVYAQSLTKKIMKGMLTGPVTILNWSFPREDISIKDSISQIALAIRDEVLDLEANGIKVIQIDEAALREKLPLRKTDWYKEYLDFAIPAFRLTHSGVKPETQIHTHMCYSEFTDIIPAIDDMDADVITFEASRSDLLILDSLRENNFETEVGPGVYDIHSPRVPSVEEITNVLKIMLTKIDSDKLWVNPDCGLKTRGMKESDASLRNMVCAAKKIREKAQ